jgi:hypothetical protein
MSKKQSEHTIADILRLKPKWFLAKQTNPDACTALLTQLHMMLDHGYNHLAPQLFMEVFGLWDISLLPVPEFNKLLMEFTAKPRTTELNPEVTKLGLLTRETVIPAIQHNKEGLRETLRQVTREQREAHEQAERLTRDIVDLQLEVTRYLQKAARLEDSIHSYEEELQKPAKVDPERLRILKAVPDSWIVASVDPESFTMVRRTPLIVNYTNAGTGQAKTLNLGIIGVKFSWTLDCQESFGVADYISPPRSYGAIHPHLSGASICWGNVGHRAKDSKKARDWKAFFELFEVLMTTYNPDSPYIALHTLERVKNENWTHINPRLMYRRWWKDPSMRNQLVRTWARTASDKWLAQINDAFAHTPPRPNRDPRGRKPLDVALGKLSSSGQAPPSPRPVVPLSPLAEPPRIQAELDKVMYEFCKSHAIPLLENEHEHQGATWSVDPATPQWVRSLLEGAGVARVSDSDTYRGRWDRIARGEWYHTDRDDDFVGRYVTSWGMPRNSSERAGRRWTLPASAPRWVVEHLRREMCHLSVSGGISFDFESEEETAEVAVPF